MQTAFVVDGRESSDHEQAFALAKGAEQLGLIEGTRPQSARAAEEVFGTDRASLLSQRIGEQASALREQDDGVAERNREPVELLQTYDHPRVLVDALENSRQLLVIVSPWIKERIVDRRFLGRLEQRLEEGVRVFIGYGLGEGLAGSDLNAVNALERLAGRYSNLSLKRFGDTHAKVIIWIADTR